MRRLAQKGLVVALAAGFATFLASAAVIAQPAGIATHTTLATESHEIGGKEVRTYSVTVAGEDGAPAKGIVMLTERGRNLAGAALDSEGKAEIRCDGLPTGSHALQAEYHGDSAHAASESDVIAVSSATSGDTFALSINPTSATVSAPGDAASIVATITPGSSFTGFVSLSCAGPPVSAGSYTDTALPVGVTCTFTPENLQVTSSTTSFNSDFTIQTTAPAGQLARSGKGVSSRPGGSPLVLAVLLPGVFGLGLLARKRKLLARTALILTLGLVSVVGTSACNARYKYLNHPPTANDGTPTGAYTLTIWAQTSNGVTASEQFLTMPFTVN